MSIGYFTLHGECENTIIIERSKFICSMKCVDNEDDAKSFIETIRKKHSLANHNCYAYIADDKGLLLLDLKDLRSMVQYVGDNAKEYKLTYGNISSQSVGAIQRALLELEDEGGDIFFGEPALDLSDWIDWDENDKGVMNILECQELFQHPLLYATFLLWMLSELYEMLPEAGDLDKPKLAFFFDEAHLLFNDAPKALVEKVEQVVRLIRSKGVSVWFISQSPSDLPDSVLGQIGNRIQHALRAYTPKDQKALRAAAQSFRTNPNFDTEEALQALGVGEALVSVLDEKGVPTIVERAGILPPRSSMNAVNAEQIEAVIVASPLVEKYTAVEDRESAYEVLAEAQAEAAEAERIAAEEAAAEKATLEAEKQAEKERKEAQRQQKAKTAAKTTSNKSRTSSSSRKKQSAIEKSINKTINQTANTIGRELGKQLVRGLLGTLKK